MKRAAVLAMLLIAIGCGDAFDKQDNGDECASVVSFMATECEDYDSSVASDTALLECENGRDYDLWTCRIDCFEGADDDCYSYHECLSRNCD